MVAVTEMTNWGVDLIDVRKTYGRSVHALRGVNVQVGRGEIFGLLGPNGAGKSTLVKIMMTVVRPTHGLGTILGRPIGHREKRGRIGYLPEDHRFPAYLSGLQVLDFYAALGKVPRAVRRKRAAELLDLVGMSQWARTRAGQYSKGMLQRLGIAQAMMNDPDLLVLDEPTDGLDPVGRRDVRAMLLDLRKRGKTVFLNSHLLSELEMVCDRVAILVDGLVARQGTLTELTEHTIEYRIVFSGAAASVESGQHTSSPSEPRALARADSRAGDRALPDIALKTLREMGATIDGPVVTLRGHDVQKVNAAIDVLRGAGVTIESVEPHRFSLEDVLVEVMGEGGAVRPPQARPVGSQ